MSDKAPHTAAVPGAAAVARQTPAGREEMRNGYLAQAVYFEEKGDAERGRECRFKAEQLS